MSTESEIKAAYEPELRKARTEHLLGKSSILSKLPIDSKRVSHYVHTRIDGKTRLSSYEMERELYSKFRPGLEEDYQLICVVGGAGSGKSTFIRFFFQYFLPYYYEKFRPNENSKTLLESYRKNYKKHIFLYVDFRRTSRESLDSFLSNLYDDLADSLETACENRKLTSRLVKKDNTITNKDLFQTNLMLLAKEKDEMGRRKWYISLICDNADQLEEFQLDELVKQCHKYIGESPRAQSPNAPIDKIDNAFWRVILPVRPETKENLDLLKWDPLTNLAEILLPPIELRELVKERAKLLKHTIIMNGRHFDGYHTFGKENRPYFGFSLPSQIGSDFEKLLNATLTESVTSKEAIITLEKLINGSSRRALTTVPRIALSKSFSYKYKEGIRENRNPVVSPFYFFTGLICGQHDTYRSNNKIILNFYQSGSKKYTPHGTLIGVHALTLLRVGQPWKLLTESLLKIGYEDSDIICCETSFKNKGLIIKLANGTYMIEDQILEGQWRLFKDPAYTDNMAITCGLRWKLPDVNLTNPIKKSHLLKRTRSSVSFIDEVWTREKKVASYDVNSNRIEGDIDQFYSNFNELKLRPVTHTIACEYLDRLKKLPNWDRPAEVIEGKKGEWRKIIRRLEDIVNESKQPGIHMMARGTYNNNKNGRE